MNATTPLPADVIALLDRLDHRLGEPCDVPGCMHHAGAEIIILRAPAPERLAA